jgi:ectoine hydroxylase-related dioxygenase (phytanoyl-CoA dioxygenase family)
VATPLPPTADLDDLDALGFAIVRQVVDDTVVASLAEAVQALLATAGRPHGLRNVASMVPEVRDLAGSPRVAAIVRSALGGAGRLVRSVLFDKVPGANWKVPWHQDLTIAVDRRRDVAGFGPWSVKDGIISVQPPPAVLEAMVTVRVHLDDCGPDNGPVRVIEGSHRMGRLAPSQIDHLIAEGVIETCTCAAGDALVMKPLLLQASSPAVAPSHRRVVHLDFAAGGLPHGLEWNAMT